LGFLNLYAPNNTSDRCLLWEQLIISLPNACRWVVAGNFNMVERSGDKTSQCGKIIPQRELPLFDAFKEYF
jgi:hypothetical protein